MKINLGKKISKSVRTKKKKKLKNRLYISKKKFEIT